MPGVYAVVLTYNRKALLRQCLAAIGRQTRPPDGVIVVDNGSRDDTEDVLRGEFPQVEYCRLRRNCGAAGGFNLAMRLSIASGADHIWVMDDDVIAEPDALQKLIESQAFVEGEGDEPPFVVSVARTPDGALTNVPEVDRSVNAIHYSNWPRYLAQGLAPVTRATFVSILLPARTFRRHGYPIASMFIWGEDTEFTLRVTKGAPGYLCGGSRVTHVRAAPGKLDIRTENDEDRMRWHQYLVRNTVYTTRRHRSTGRLIRYVRSTTRRVIQLALRGHGRRAMILAAGLAQGFVFRPNEGRFDDALMEDGIAFMSPTLFARIAATSIEGTAAGMTPDNVVRLHMEARG